MKKEKLATIIVVIAVLIIAATIIYSKINPVQKTTEEIAKCIGENSVVYVQLGCHACQIQEDLFGESYQYITEVDCYFEREKCTNITSTPTWIIKGESYEGVQTIEKLQELTNC